jgi:hypothetical protein
MRSIRLFAFLFCLLGLGAAAQAQTTPICYSAPAPVQVSYPNGGGTINIAYQVCFNNPTDYSSFTWNGTVTYNNVNFGTGFTINGSMSILLNYAANSISSISFNGGPLNYVVGGQPYVVTFNNLVFNFGPNFQATGAGGQLTINGVNVAGDTAYWGYLFH